MVCALVPRLDRPLLVSVYAPVISVEFSDLDDSLLTTRSRRLIIRNENEILSETTSSFREVLVAGAVGVARGPVP